MKLTSKQVLECWQRCERNVIPGHKDTMESLTDELNKELARMVGELEVGDGDCWEWPGFINTGGYGIINIKGKKHFAHRLSYETFAGPIPKDMLVCHKCDNRCCINPTHLFVGTHSDNVRDCVSKKRDANSRVTECPFGHPYDKTNTIIRIRNGRESRNCRLCKRRRTNEWQKTRLKSRNKWKTHQARLVCIEPIGKESGE